MMVGSVYYYGGEISGLILAGVLISLSLSSLSGPVINVSLADLLADAAGA